VFGVRWAVGVQLVAAAEGPPIRSAQDLGRLTGPIAPELGIRLEERMRRGDFGDWPDAGVPRLRQVSFVGVGKQEELVAAARRQALDLLMVFSLTPRPVARGKQASPLVRVRVVDVATEKTLWASESVSGGAGAGPAFVADVLKRLDDGFRLQPIPKQTAEEVKQQLQQMDAAKLTPEAGLAVLLEVRYFQAAQLLTAEEAAGYYDAILGAGKGKDLAAGDEARRAEVLQAWLKAAPG